MRGCRAATAAHQVDAGLSKAPAERGEFRRGHFEDRLAVHKSGKPRIGFGGQRHSRMGFHGLDEGKHGLRPGGAVAAHRIGAEALQRDQGSHGIGPAECPAVRLIGHGDEGEAVTAFLHGDQGGPRLLDIHHGFDDKQIDAALQESQYLFFENRHCLLKGQIAEGLDKPARGADVSGNKGLPPHGGRCQPGDGPVDLPDVFDSILAQLQAVGAEGAGVNNIRTGVRVRPVNFLDGFRVFDDPGLRTDAGRHSALLQLRSHRSVQNEDLVLQKIYDF
jgi:hypothetical protein